MKLPELLKGIAVEAVEGPLDLEIAEVRDDSRSVGTGDLFVALSGHRVDGHTFLREVATRGAVAAVGSDGAALGGFPGTRVRVISTRRALAEIAARRYGDPARALKLVAVTGTNGKTTTTYLIESILRAAGHRPGVIGTVNYRFAGQVRTAPYTTPTALELHAILAEMRTAGCTHVVMEASSHALALERLWGLEFRVGAFTNLTQDHLDFHGSMEAYFDAKVQLMRHLLRPSDGVGVVFFDTPYSSRMTKEVVGDRLIVSLEHDAADVHATRIETTIDGIACELASPLGPIRLRSQMVGRYNVANLAVATGVAISLGIPARAIEQGVAELFGVPGRLERIENSLGLAVVVDYAHTHDALENVIAALRPLTPGRILCVFGCGGDRDRTKRPRMGRSVARDADLAIVTSDNPRTEDPSAIIEMILQGIPMPGTPQLSGPELPTARRGFLIEPDRRAAIGLTIAAAQPGDVVLIAGKGHEDYQIVGTTRHPFDDRAVAREALEERGAK